MTNNTNELERLVLQSVANDFEELEMIVSEIGKWTSGNEAAPDASRIEPALMDAIREGSVKAYDHELVPTEADPQRIHSLWFYITKQGLTRMQRLEVLEEGTKGK
jgi:hypothetical protein